MVPPTLRVRVNCAHINFISIVSIVPIVSRAKVLPSYTEQQATRIRSICQPRLVVEVTHQQYTIFVLRFATFSSEMLYIYLYNIR